MLAMSASVLNFVIKCLKALVVESSKPEQLPVGQASLASLLTAENHLHSLKRQEGYSWPAVLSCSFSEIFSVFMH